MSSSGFDGIVLVCLVVWVDSAAVAISCASVVVGSRPKQLIQFDYKRLMPCYISVRVFRWL
jgi:hypothetical protein